MKIKFYAEIEVPVDERFSRTDYITITLEDEAILELAKAITAAQQGAHPTGLNVAQKEEVRQMIQSALDTGSAGALFMRNSSD